VDGAEILSAQEEVQLNQQIKQLIDESSNEIGVLTVKDGEGVDAAQFSTQVGRDWGIGTKENKNGVLIFVSLQNPKRIQIAVSTGLEGALTDATSASISRNDIAPKFRQSKYYEGLSAGVSAIDKATKGEYKREESSAQTKKNVQGGIWLIVFMVIILQTVFTLVTTTKSWWFGGVLGGITGGVIGAITHSALTGLGILLVLSPLGLLIDYKLSKNYQKHAQKRKDDKNHHFPWYFGGGGGFGSGSGLSGGGFSSGGFSGGGSFGGGGGGSSW